LAYLLTVNEAISTRANGGIDVVACGLEKGTDVDASGIVNADMVGAESFLVVGRQPWSIEDLDEMGDVMFTKHVSVLGGDKGAYVEGTCGRMTCNWCW